VTRLGSFTYLVWLLAWSLPVLIGQWLAFPGFLARSAARWLPLSLALAAYFAAADAIGIATGVWDVEQGTILGVRIAGVLPLEEALFFFLTTLMVAQTTVLFLWRFGDLPGEPWRGWERAFGFGRGPARIGRNLGLGDEP
jgi:lycopene cyclase domain-containing protein